ncbi:MAG: hypothetical protein IJ155_08805 [Prevotella sp.]|nr:hypothetical protein [Prevotella sp.]
MKKLLLLKSMLLLCALVAGSGTVWAEEVTYKITSKGAVSVTGTAPTESELTFSNTYTSDYRQMTSGKYQTWTFSGFSGLHITKLVLSMKSNSNKGAGSLTYSTDGGTTFSDIVANSAFNTANWYGAWSTAFVDVTKDVDITTGDDDFVLKFLSSQNSIYCESIKITYETTSSSDLEDNDLTLTGAPIALEFDLYNDDTKVINYSTSSTGAVSVVENDYVDAVVNAENKTITLTAKKTTNSTQTITVNQAADETYKSGSATFTVSISDSTPFVGGDVTFVGGTDKGSSTSQTSDEVSKSVVTISSTKAGLGYDEYRIYSGSSTTISTSNGKITKIVFTVMSGYDASNLSTETGTYSNGTWSGNAESVTFAASAQVRASQIVVTVSPVVTLAVSGYASYCSPFALDLTPTEDYAAYAVTATSGSSVTFSKIEGAVPAETPFILFGKDMGGEIVCLPITTGETTAVSGNMLRGTLAETAITTISGDYTNFGLSNGSFVKISDGTLPANKAYLPILTANVPSNARLSIIFEDETTGISNVDSPMMNVEDYYNLAGQKVAQPTKGLYIVNGKKVIIK